jgi:hypothetical protein
MTSRPIPPTPPVSTGWRANQPDLRALDATVHRSDGRA